MIASADPIETCLREVDQARKRVSRIDSKQITRGDDRDYLESVADSWFKSHRPVLAARVPEEALTSVDADLRAVLDATARSSARTTYLISLKAAKDALSSLRGVSLVPPRSPGLATEAPPDLSALASDPAMKARS